MSIFRANSRLRSAQWCRLQQRVAAIFVLALIVTAAHAQTQNAPPEITIGPSTGTGSTRSALARGIDRCVDVEIGSSRAFDCLNRKLKDQVDQANTGSITAPLTAGSPDLQVGVVNIPAVKQQYGKNFGVSAFPYRPPPLIYSAPLRSGR